jgi:NADH dehydrogenase
MFDPAASVSGRGAVAEQPRALPLEQPGRGRRIVVTGAAGFVGSHTCRQLAADGWRVLALVRNPVRAAERLGHLKIEIRVGDLLDTAYLRSSMDGADSVVHLAAIAIERNGDTYQSANVDATRNVVESASVAGVRRLLHMSQNGAASNSPHRFLRSKGTAQDIVTSSSLAWTVLRPSVIFGAEDEFVNVLARMIRLTPIILPLPAHGRTRFQPVAVDDVASAIARAMADDTTSDHIFPIGGSAELSLRDIAERILIAMHTSRVVVGVPTAIIRPFVAALWHIVSTPPVSSELLDILSADNTVPLNTLSSSFGITPTPFAPEELLYLRRITARDAFRSLFRH